MTSTKTHDDLIADENCEEIHPNSGSVTCGTNIIVRSNPPPNTLAIGPSSKYLSFSSVSSPTSPFTNLNETENKLTSIKLENFRNWTISTYKISKQQLYEKLGKTSRTIDNEIESQIDALRETQKKYSAILRSAKVLSSHYSHVLATQYSLGESFNDLANKSPELRDEFLYNGETQRKLSKNGEYLIDSLNNFVSSMYTLIHKTMEDTLSTIRQYETARIEYDAYRCDLEYFSKSPKNDGTLVKVQETEAIFALRKNEFEKLRSDLQIKLKFLGENRIKVMHKNLLLFNAAFHAYSAGNQQDLKSVMGQLLS